MSDEHTDAVAMDDWQDRFLSEYKRGNREDAETICNDAFSFFSKKSMEAGKAFFVSINNKPTMSDGHYSLDNHRRIVFSTLRDFVMLASKTNETACILLHVRGEKAPDLEERSEEDILSQAKAMRKELSNKPETDFTPKCGTAVKNVAQCIFGLITTFWSVGKDKEAPKIINGLISGIHEELFVLVVVLTAYGQG